MAVTRTDRNDCRRRLSMLRWSLVPAWAKDPHIGHKLVNARVETVWEKSSLRSAFASLRCLIPADRFYEWKREGAAKRPWLIGMKDREPFAFASLWECWSAPGGGAEALETFALLTTATTRPWRRSITGCRRSWRRTRSDPGSRMRRLRSDRIRRSP